ncbi:DUF5131 family protein [Actomonas aquatica]|uniref:DUF5131 family protein n=1 Tax=Actomonas aquatica TaxID=2866162 RepID=A0ABZ1CD80_9BACT|nr:DUF5131 family protein [Opitutus sp. WL0086]WRQ89372.1 DUF5131 family protein [Opitutus sp. WL0086]
MGLNTKIEWTHHTFNIVWGCAKVSEGCENCYAEKWAARCGFEWGPRAARRTFGDKHWREPLAWNRAAEKAGQRRRVFCSSMADVFEDHPTVSTERAKLFALIDATPWLDWMLLTKRPENIEHLTAFGYSDWPRNAWLGFTAENQKRFDERWPIVEHMGRLFRIPYLFCSAEPLLGPLDISAVEWNAGGEDEPESATLDLIIVGGESGGNAREFVVDHAYDIRLQCDRYDISFFMKQLGARPVTTNVNLLDWPDETEWLPWGDHAASARPNLYDRKGGDMSEWPEELKIREMPNE